MKKFEKFSRKISGQGVGPRIEFLRNSEPSADDGCAEWLHSKIEKKMCAPEKHRRHTGARYLNYGITANRYSKLRRGRVRCRVRGLYQRGGLLPRVIHYRRRND